MRLIRQYRGDTTSLVGKSLIGLAAIGSLYFLTNVVVGIFKATVVGTDIQNHDQALLRDLYGKDSTMSIEDQIAKREQLIPQLHEKVVLHEVNRELAQLYEVEGRKNLNNGNLSLAEQSYLTASELDPSNATYLSDMAQLYADAAVQQSEASQRLVLLKSSTAYYDDAIDREADSTKKRALTDRAASVNYNLAKEELKVPGKKSEALTDLERAKKMAMPGSRIAEDAAQMMFLLR